MLEGLKRGNFRILDNGKPQVITQFESTDDPITIVLLLEYSGLAYDYFAYKAAYWGSGFLDHLDGKDWVALITYDNSSPNNWFRHVQHNHAVCRGGRRKADLLLVSEKSHDTAENVGA